MEKTDIKTPQYLDEGMVPPFRFDLVDDIPHEQMILYITRGDIGQWMGKRMVTVWARGRCLE